MARPSLEARILGLDQAVVEQLGLAADRLQSLLVSCGQPDNRRSKRVLLLWSREAADASRKRQSNLLSRSSEHRLARLKLNRPFALVLSQRLETLDHRLSVALLKHLQHHRARLTISQP